MNVTQENMAICLAVQVEGGEARTWSSVSIGRERGGWERGGGKREEEDERGERRGGEGRG